MTSYGRKATILWLTVCLTPSMGAAEEEASLKTLARSYQSQVKPLLSQYCNECHSGDLTEAEVDLGAFADLAAIRRKPKVWLKVREMLDSNQMPPKDAKLPSEEERLRLRKWVRDFLITEAKVRAGDPGRVVLRRLSNAEYTYTLRDLTGVASLDPAREFPVDGAAGEGFTNTGSALVMSPSLVRKYLDAAKDVASHAVLLPDGIRFAPQTTRRDQTDALLSAIREFYQPFTGGPGGGAKDWQGKSDPNEGGSLPLERYLLATLEERDALNRRSKSLSTVADERQLNAKYLTQLWSVLAADQTADGGSLLLDQLRVSWRAAKPSDAKRLTAEVNTWQRALWKFNKVGHIGRQDGPKSWMQAVTPLSARQEIKLALPPSKDGDDVVFYLTAGTAGDGGSSDYAVWRNARLVRAGKAPIALRDLQGMGSRIKEVRRQMLQRTTAFLSAAGSLRGRKRVSEQQIVEAAKRHQLDRARLTDWLDYLQIGDLGEVAVTGHFTQTMRKSGNYDFVQGWGSGATPSIIANSSDQQVRIPGISRPHSVVVHPSPTLFAAVGWRSPISGVVQVTARVADAHPECGNGVEWYLQYRTKSKLGDLWSGDFGTRGAAQMKPKTIAVRKGELLSLIVGPRQKSHTCDLTEVSLQISEAAEPKRVWNLAKDVSSNILQSNPHSDAYGNKETWHFYKGEMTKLHKDESRPVTPPAGSLLARWQGEQDETRRMKLAEEIQSLALADPPADANAPDALLHRQLQSLAAGVDTAALQQGLKPDPRFGQHPLGHAVEPTDLIVKAPAVLEFRAPAELAEGRELVATGQLDAEHGGDGSIQLEASVARPELRVVSAATPIVVADDSSGRRRVERALREYRDLFPIALCYARIVPIDEVVTLTLFYREDDQLRRLMLDDQQTVELNRLWDELRFVSQEPLKHVVAFEQIVEFATQDRPDLVKAFKPFGEIVRQRAVEFRKQMAATEPAHLQAVLDFADRAWRRPLTSSERERLRALYERLRGDGIGHEEATHVTLARVLTSPSFLYRREQPATGKVQAPVSNMELASRLSYFLWSTLPDQQLRVDATSGRLVEEEVILEQTRRMLKDERTRRLAIHFACQWLHLRDFDRNDDKNEKLYPQFAKLRADMYEETVRFFEDMFRNDGSVMGMFDADHTFLNEALAKHYGIADVRGEQWRRVEGIRARGRGGVLGMATVLASQSGASRTSPILRGNWVSETLLGERLPRPPANVPQLPDALPEGLTARQLIERHTSVPECAKCHAKIDPYGFALEQYDAIGRLRPKQVDTKTRLLDGKAIEGVAGLRNYLVKDRHNEILRQFCRKLLGYALGREVQLSDELLLVEMQEQLKSREYRFSAAVETVVTSRQFREIRPRQMTLE